MIPVSNTFTLNILLVAVLATLVWFTWSGFHRGFVKLAISLVSMLLTFILVASFTPKVCSFLTERTKIDEVCRHKIYMALLEKNSVRENVTKEDQEETIKSYSLPGMVKESLIEHNTEDEYQQLLVSVFADYVSGFLSKLLIKIMAFVFSFVIIMVVLKITFLSLEWIAKIPMINGINKLAGLFFGFCEGMFIVWMAFCILMIIMGDSFYRLVFQSRILSLIYEENAILRFFGKL